MAYVDHAALAMVAALLFVAGAGAQSSDLSIGGVVTNARTGEPIPRALVQLIRYETRAARQPGENGRSAAPPAPTTFSTLTEVSGAFRFAGLAQGTYFVSARKPDMVAFSEKSVRSIELTASVNNVSVQLSPLGVITGTVTDQDGRPIRGAQVLAITTNIVDGIRRTNVGHNETTDDRGVYRIWGVSPGKYYLKAAARAGGTRLAAGANFPVAGQDGFAPVYTGGAATLDSAVPVTIEPGAEVRADIQVKLEPAYRITGSLENFVPRRTAKFELLSGDEDISGSRVTVNGDTGRFQIQEVTPGVYSLRVTQEQTRAETVVTVAGADVNGVAARLAPGVDIPVIKQITGGAPKSDDDDEDSFEGMQLGSCHVSLGPPGRSSGGQTYPSDFSRPSGEEGPVKIAGVLPGRYRVTIQCYGAYARFATMGSQDLLSNPFVTVQPEAAPLPIQVVAARGGGRVTGRITAPNLKPNGNIVLVVPQFSETTGPALGYVGEFRGPDQTAGEQEFEVDNLAPGSYLVYAFASDEKIEYRNPAFLKSLTGGVAARVTAGAGTKIEIQEIMQ